MITTLRRSFKSNFNKVILWITILGLAGVTALSELFKRSSNSPWVAMVNGNEVSYNDFARKATMVQERMNSLRAQYGEYADFFFQALGFPTDPKLMAMEQLIQESVLNQAASDLGLQVSDAYVAEKLSNPLFVQQELGDVVPMGVFDPSGGINPRALHNYLHHVKLSGVEFEDNVTRALERKTIREIASGASYIPELEIKQQFIANYVDKNYSVLVLPLKTFLKEQQKTAITEEELKAYFDKHNSTTKKYWIPEKRSGVVWNFAPERYGIVIGDEAVAAFYEDHKASKYADKPSEIQVRYILFQVSNEATRQAVLDKAKQTREDLLKKPNAFADTAKEVSSDRESAVKGGLLPVFARGKQEAAIDKASFLLKQDGDISEVVPTSKGYALVQRVSKTAPTFKSLSNVKKEIVSALTQQKFNELFARDIQSLIDRTLGDSAALAQELKSKGGKEELVSAVVRNEGKWAEALFGLAAAGQATLLLHDGNGVVVQLASIHERNLPSLESIKDVVSNDIHEERASEQLHTKTQEALSMARTKSLKEVQAAYGGDLENINGLSQKNSAKVEALKKRGFPTDRILQLENIGAAVDFQVDHNSYIVRLDHLENYTPEQYQAKRAELKLGLEQSAKRLFVEGFVASLIRSAKIETNESLITLNEE